MANDGKSLEGIILEDIHDVQVNVRDAMTLSRQGIVVPEANLFYNDEDIVYDEDIDELEVIGEYGKMSWREKEHFFSQEIDDEAVIKVKTPNESFKTWLVKNSERIGIALEPILRGMYDAEEKFRRGID